MQSTLRPYTTAGAAIVGAGLIAVIPMAAAFLQAAVAVAGPGDDAGFTVGGLSFDDPVAISGFGGTQTPGYESIAPLFSNAPLLAIGVDKPPPGLVIGSQQFTLEDSGGTTLGTVDTQVNVQNLLGIDTAQFTVASTDPASGLSDSQTAELPADGTVYSITNLGSGFANVYEADPNADGTAASTITDTFVTPFGNIDVPTSYDAIATLSPATALEALGNTSSNPDVSDNAFTIDATTFDPGSGGFNASTLAPLSSFAPLLNFSAGSISVFAIGQPRPTQDLEVYNGGADDGTAHTSLFYSNLLGLDSTQFTVQGITPTADAVQSALTGSDLDFSGADFTAQDLANALTASNAAGPLIPFGTGDITSANVAVALGVGGIHLSGSGITDADIADALNASTFADLPAVGTVYSVTDLGSGYAIIYEAVPATDGTSASTITDTLVTPFGNIDVPTSYDATAPMDPATPLGALAATSSTASLSDNAFTIDGTTFDPGSDGFNTAPALFGIAPLLEIAGAQLNLFGPQPILVQDGVEVYDSSGTDLGSVDLGENLSNILGLIDTTQFTVSSVDAATGLTASEAAELPAVGTIYSVTDLGGGFTNVYEAVPDSDGTAASSITDTLVTPFGNVDLSTMFDAIAALDPGDAAAGVSTSASGFDLFDPGTWF